LFVQLVGSNENSNHTWPPNRIPIVIERLRNPLYFALAMAVPGIAAILLLYLPDSSTWDRTGWIVFAAMLPGYVALCALAAFLGFVVASLLLRRSAPIAKRRLISAGVIAGCLYLLGSFLTDPSWPESYFLAAWTGLAFAASLYALLRWGKNDG
jgi:hypothetical protein